MVMTRLSMRTIREVLRLHLGLRLNKTQVSKSCGISRSTIGDYLQRAALSNLSWPLPEDLDDARLEALLFPPITSSGRQIPQPEWSTLHREMQTKGVTLQLLWHEYRTQYQDGYQYSQFSSLYSQWKKTVDLVFRPRHVAGEKLFIDFAGPTIPIHDPQSGEITKAQIFVAVWGASNYTYAEALASQKVNDFVGAHTRAFKYFGCVPHVLVPDNLKSAVIKCDRHEPDINPTYYAMAGYYRCAVVPARPRKPKDKAKVEAGVLLVERWILASLRHRKFFSIAELNEAIAELLERLNSRPFKKMPGCRLSSFKEIDRPAAQGLPLRPFEIRDIKIAKVHIDYHVELEKHYYSVPYQYVQKKIEIHHSETIVELFHNGQRIASHPRLHKIGGYSTQSEHMPEAHRQYARWTPERLATWARMEAGPSAAIVAEKIMSSKRHPEEGFKAVLGLINLGSRYGVARLEKACEQAIALHSFSYQTVKGILKSGRDQNPTRVLSIVQSLDHENVRGPIYYQ